MGFSIFILYNKGIPMRTIKAGKLKEVLTSRGLDEGFIDRIFKRLQKSKTDSQLKAIDKEISKSKEDKEKYQNKLEKMLVQKYGTYDKIPDYHKKFLTL